MREWVDRWERHQVALYLLALALGTAAGLAMPAVAEPAETAITPVLGLLLYATFLGVPFGRVGESLRDWRFLVTVLVLDFVIVPPIVFVLSRIVAHDRALLIGVLFVLLTPCVDYVIVFTGIAGGARDRLLAAAPLLMLGQLLLLPVLLRWFAGGGLVAEIDPAPFVEAFLLLIVLPLGAAAATQWFASRSRAGAIVLEVATAAMVPLMMLTLALVVASQISEVGARIGALLPAIPVYVLFAAIMVPLGAATGRLGGLDAPGRRAVVFSGVTRNSLVVLPLVLALPAAFDLAPLAVVAQTLVELLTMVLLARLIPRWVRDRGTRVG
ncbi:arsenic resistance protein [Leucobacter sp.]